MARCPSLPTTRKKKRATPVFWLHSGTKHGEGNLKTRATRTLSRSSSAVLRCPAALCHPLHSIPARWKNTFGLTRSGSSRTCFSRRHAAASASASPPSLPSLQSRLPRALACTAWRGSAPAWRTHPTPALPQPPPTTSTYKHHAADTAARPRACCCCRCCCCRSSCCGGCCCCSTAATRPAAAAPPLLLLAPQNLPATRATADSSTPRRHSPFSLPWAASGPRP